MLMSDIPAQGEANGGLSELVEVDFCVGTYLGAQLFKELREVELFGLHGLIIPIILLLPFYFAAYRPKRRIKLAECRWFIIAKPTAAKAFY